MSSAEHGTVKDPAQAEVLAGLSPVHASPPAPLPPILLTTGHTDPVVSPAHTYTLAAWSALPGGLVILRVEPFVTHARGPHSDANADVRQRAWLRADAETLAFVMRAVGLTMPEAEARPSP